MRIKMEFFNAPFDRLLRKIRKNHGIDYIIWDNIVSKQVIKRFKFNY